MLSRKVKKLDEIRAKFAVIEDPRHQGYVEHNLVDVLVLVLCAVFCGLDSLGNIMIYAENNRVFLRESCGIAKIPSKATLARILSMVDGAQVGGIMIEIMRERFGTAGDVVAVDGKAICSTAKSGSAHSALQILTAYITSSGVILGQEAIHKKTNEIPTFQKMLEMLDIKGPTDLIPVHILSSYFSPGLRQKPLKYVSIPANFWLTRQKICRQSARRA